MVAYAQSKTATIYLANPIDRHYSASNIRAVAVHPGTIFETRLGRHMSQEELAACAPMAPFARLTAQGAATTVWAALDPHFNKHGGVYLADTSASGAATEDKHFSGPGYAPHAYDKAAEERLWKLSFGAVGLRDDSD